MLWSLEHFIKYSHSTILWRCWRNQPILVSVTRKLWLTQFCQIKRLYLVLNIIWKSNMIIQFILWWVWAHSNTITAGLLTCLKMDVAVLQQAGQIAEITDWTQTLQLLSHVALLPTTITSPHLGREIERLTTTVKTYKKAGLFNLEKISDYHYFWLLITSDYSYYCFILIVIGSRDKDILCNLNILIV